MKMTRNTCLGLAASCSWLFTGVTVATAQTTMVGNAANGEKVYQAACAICHSPALGPNNTLIVKQGPTLLGVLGRKAGTSPHFNYSQALKSSGLTLDAGTLDRFLTDPMKAVPGTTMPIPIA